MRKGVAETVCSCVRSLFLFLHGVCIKNNVIDAFKSIFNIIWSRWTAEVKKPIKIEHLAALLAMLLDNSIDKLAFVEKIVMNMLPELLASGSTSDGEDDDDDIEDAPKGKKGGKGKAAVRWYQLFVVL